MRCPFFHSISLLRLSHQSYQFGYRPAAGRERQDFPISLPVASRTRLRLPSADALPKLRSAWSLSPSPLTTSEIAWPSAARLTASSLNSVVYACLGIFFIFSSSKVTLFYVICGRLNFTGSSICAAKKPKAFAIYY